MILIDTERRMLIDVLYALRPPEDHKTPCRVCGDPWHRPGCELQAALKLLEG